MNKHDCELRDWFASQFSYDDVIEMTKVLSADEKDTLAGSKAPRDGVDRVIWIARLDAAIRYIMADAMLLERSKRKAQ